MNKLLAVCLSTFICQHIFCQTKNYENLKKPNIIFILVDDLGYGDIGVLFQNKRKESANNNLPYLLTPNIDAMANNGAVFTQQYCNAPVCAPSRASLLTGINQGNARIRNNQFDSALGNSHTIASVLKQAGYKSCAIGKWGLQGYTNDEPYWPAHPLNRGFSNFFGYIRHKDGHEHYPVEGKYRGKKEIWENYKNISPSLEKCYTTDLFTAYAKKWIIENSKQSSPFFMYLAFDVPHAVLELPTQAYPNGNGLKGGLQWNNIHGNMINTASGNIDSYIYPEYDTANYYNAVLNISQPWPDTYKRYATATRRIDDAVGDIRQLLKDLNIDSNTLIVFTSDNGPSVESYLPDSFAPNYPMFFGSYGPFDGIKRDCFEGGIRVPTIVSWPTEIRTNKEITTPSMLSDWLATFADIAQVPIPAQSTGVSLLPSLTGKGKQKKSTVYVEYFVQDNSADFLEFEASRRNRIRNQMQMIRIDSLVGVRYDIKNADDDFEIYNIEKDPKQKFNLSMQSSFSRIQLLMKEKVLQIHRPDSLSPRPYDSAFIPSVNQPTFFSKGISWNFYLGNFPWVSKPPSKPSLKNGTSNSITGNEITNKQGILIYQGFIKIPTDGKYDFSIRASSETLVKIHEINLLTTDFEYKPGELIKASLFLKAGFHPINIHILKNKKTTTNLDFKWKVETSNKWEKMDNLYNDANSKKFVVK